MGKYIDRDALAAEIEKRKKEAESNWGGYKSYDEHRCDACTVGFYEEFLEILNTLEVKEVDLENLFQALPEKIADEKSHQVYELSIYHYDGQCVVDYVGEIDHDSLYTFGGNTLYEAIEKAWNWLCKNSTGG